MPTTTNTTPTQPAQQPAQHVPFVRMSDLEGKPQATECVIFVLSFGPWNRGVSAGFVTERAQWLVRHGYARRFDPATDRGVGFESLIRK